ncbi:MAG: glycoside hydrolase family 27 protein [Paludibacteraceae bacterium]|nr:glycoside hydrolase family 27 protein [Paludibacteraceae bacterium]
MKTHQSIILLVLCTLSFTPLSAQQPQPVIFSEDIPAKPLLCPTPPMGWSSWNTFACDINEDLIKAMADEMVATGLKDAGYIYLNLDDCWHGERDADGFIQPDPVRFPSGMKALADYVHSKGLKIGIYSDAGSATCGGKPGSLGHEYQDALQYARWGIDYLKYDWCNTENVNSKGAYSLMAKALRASGRDIVFSLCEWGDTQAYSWAENVGHLWRTTGDVNCCFDCELDHGGWKSLGVLQIMDKNEKLRQFAGPNHWNDPDMMEVGNGMTESEDRAHFSMWCMMAAPLILGNDIRSMSPATAALVMNKDMIAIDQDPLGIQGLRYRTESGLEYWLKPLQSGAWAFCILNRTLSSRTITLDFADFHMFDNLSRLTFETGSHNYKVYNIWAGKEEAPSNKSRKVTIPSHDVVVYRLTY